MKSSGKQWIFAFFTVLILIFSGCASFFYGVRITSVNNRTSVLAGGTMNFRSTGRDIVWNVSSTRDGLGGVASGTYINATGNGLTATLNVAANESSLLLFIIATSTRDNFSNVFQVRVVTVTGVSVTADNSVAVAGRAMRFRAQVSGSNSPDQDVTWKVSANAAGTDSAAPGTNINFNGTLTVSQNETSATLYIHATSSIDPTKSGYTTVSVVRPSVTSVTVAPANQTVRAGTTQQYRASVIGTYEPSQAVTWRVSSNSSGTGAVTPGTSINSGGVLTIANNESLSVLYIIATSVYDPSKTGYASASVVVPVITSISINPANTSVRAGSSLQFNVSVTGTYNPPATVTWRVSSNSSGTGAVTPGTRINSSSGLLTVANNESLSRLYIIATSTFNPAMSAVAAVTVTVPTITDISISPMNQTVQAGGSLQFYASVRGTNSPDTSVTWRVSSNAAGTGGVTYGTVISANGLLTIAPNETSGTLYIFAVSAFDPSKNASVIVSVSRSAVTLPAPAPNPPATSSPVVTSVVVSPVNITVQAGGSTQFSVVVIGANNHNTAVTWRVGSSTTGTGSVAAGTNISSNGFLTISANETFTTLYVMATSVADPTKSGRAIVTIGVPAPAAPAVTSVTVSPSSRTITAGNSYQFSAAVAGTNNPATSVTWRVSSNAAGTGSVAVGTGVNSSGLLTVSANETNTTLYVIATSTVDTTKSGSATVTVSIPAPAVPTVASVTVSPSSQTITRGNNQQFSATVTGTNNPATSVTWRVSSNAAGTGSVAVGTGVNSSGLLTVSANETNTTLYVIATSTVDTTKSGSAVVTVGISAPAAPAVTYVTVSPSSMTITVGNSYQFSAAVAGTNNPATSVTWRVSSNAAGTGSVASGTSVNSSGLLTVSANETNTTLYVIATSTADTTKSGSATVTVSIPAPAVPTVTSVTVSPSSQTITRGNNQQFSATVAGTNNPATSVTWRVSSNAAGTGSVASGTSVNSSGLLTVSANETNTTLYVIATSTVDTTKSGSATVTVSIPTPTVTSISISPSTQNMERGSSYQFSAIVRGDNNPSGTVTWRVSSNAAGTGSVTSGTSINSSGLLTVSANETNATLYVIATSTVDTTKSGSSTISVIIRTPTVTSISISPSTQNMERGSSYQFSAIVRGDNNPSGTVTWRVSSNAAGTGSVAAGTSINSSGLLAVSANETNTTLYVIATSTVDTTKSGSAAVTVNIPAPVAASITVSPAVYETRTNTTVQLSAAVTGLSNTNIIWSVSSNAAGTGTIAPGTTVSTSGRLTVAPNEWNRTLYVVARSAADSSVFGSATVTITNNNENQGSNQGQAGAP